MAQTIFTIPLVAIPQTFVIDLAGVTYNLTNKWNDSPDAGWVLDIADSAQNPIVAGLPLITGCNVLEGLGYLGINGELWVYTDGDSSEVPTLTNLGSNSNLYFTTEMVDNGG